MELRHGGLVVDIPETWMDRSTLLFIKPPRKPILPTTVEVAPTTEAISINFVLRPDLDAGGVLDEHLRSLQVIHPAFQVIENGDFSCGLGDGLCAVVRFEMEGRAVKQLLVAVGVGKVTVLASGAAGEGAYAGVEPELRRILGSMRTITVSREES